jgi:hypothetical protein
MPVFAQIAGGRARNPKGSCKLWAPHRDHDGLYYDEPTQGNGLPHSPQCTLTGFGPSNLPLAGRSTLHDGHFVSIGAAHWGQNFGASKIKVECT